MYNRLRDHGRKGAVIEAISAVDIAAVRAVRAEDIVQPDCCAAGGLTECLKIADMADAWHLRFIPHAWGSGIALAATLHLPAMVAPSPPAVLPINEFLLELDRSPNVFRERVVTSGLEITPREFLSASGRRPLVFRPVCCGTTPFGL